jgi:glycine dehydrogenase subunit 2
VAAEAHADPELLKTAPHSAPVRRLDEATAARRPDLHWQLMTGAESPCPQ